MSGYVLITDGRCVATLESIESALSRAFGVYCPDNVGVLGEDGTVERSISTRKQFEGCFCKGAGYAVPYVDLCDADSGTPFDVVVVDSEHPDSIRSVRDGVHDGDALCSAVMAYLSGRRQTGGTAGETRDAGDQVNEVVDDGEIDAANDGAGLLCLTESGMAVTVNRFLSPGESPVMIDEAVADPLDPLISRVTPDGETDVSRPTELMMIGSATSRDGLARIAAQLPPDRLSALDACDVLHVSGDTAYLGEQGLLINESFHAGAMVEAPSDATREALGKIESDMPGQIYVSGDDVGVIGNDDDGTVTRIGLADAISGGRYVNDDGGLTEFGAVATATSLADLNAALAGMSPVRKRRLEADGILFHDPETDEYELGDQGLRVNQAYRDGMESLADGHRYADALAPHIGRAADAGGKAGTRPPSGRTQGGNAQDRGPQSGEKRAKSGVPAGKTPEAVRTAAKGAGGAAGAAVGSAVAGPAGAAVGEQIGKIAGDAAAGITRDIAESMRNGRFGADAAAKSVARNVAGTAAASAGGAGARQAAEDVADGVLDDMPDAASRPAPAAEAKAPQSDGDDAGAPEPGSQKGGLSGMLRDPDAKAGIGRTGFMVRAGMVGLLVRMLPIVAIVLLAGGCAAGIFGLGDGGTQTERVRYASRVEIATYSDPCDENAENGESASSGNGSFGTGVLAKAKEFSADKSIGYSQDTRFHNPNMDCSSFVWYCLTEGGGIDKKSLNGGSPFATGSEAADLKAVGFSQHDFNPSELKPGDVLLKNGHTEIYLGKYDVNDLDADGNPRESESGVQLSIGSHQNENHGAHDRNGAYGDQWQSGDRCWYGGEVGAVRISSAWLWYFRADNVKGYDNGTSDASSAPSSSSSSKPSGDKKSFVNKWAPLIDTYLSGSPLASQGRVFAEAAYDNNVDPRWSPAISCIESSKGRHCANAHNAWGMRGGGGWASWGSWEEGIMANVKLLGGPLYGGKITKKGAATYCEGGDAPGGWYDKVSSEMNRIAPDGETSGASGDEGLTEDERKVLCGDEAAENSDDAGGGGTLSDGSISGSQQKVIGAAKSTGSPGGGLCAMWVSQVFNKAGMGYPGGNACDMYANWCKSSNMSDLKPGMIVAVGSHPHTSAGRIYGHVGIYIGDGKIRDNIGYIREESVQDWINYYGSQGQGTVPAKWGWVNGKALS